MLPATIRLLVAASLLVAPLHAATVTVHAPRADGCVVHVVEEGSADEQVAPCGQAVVTQGRRAFAWVETATRITPFLTDVTGGGVFDVRDLAGSGTIVFPADAPLRAGERLRLVSLVDSLDRALFVREITAVDAKPRMPAGRAVALRVDERGQTTAASIVEVRADAETIVWPASPRARDCTIVASLTRPRADDDRVAIALADVDGEHAPAAMVDGSDALFAMWDSCNGASPRLRVQSDTLRLADDAVEVTRGAVTMIERPLVPLPSLTVTIGALAQAHTLSLEVAPADDETRVLVRRDVAPNETVVIPSLPAALLVLDLNVDDAIVQRQVDLTSGSDATIHIPLEPMTVTGTVRSGERAARATLRFLQKGKAVSVETDDAGSYEVTLWHPRRYVVETVLAGRAAAFSQVVTITSSRRLDIDVPANAVAARVYDRESGKAVAGATIAVHNRWSDGSSIVTVPAASERTELPPLRNGIAELRVTAPGYADAELIRVAVDDALRSRVIDIPLSRRDGDARMIQLQLPGGTPAAGAELASWAGERLLWRVVADERGQLALPDAYDTNQRVIARHPAAASQVMIFLDPGDTIAFDAAAPPLTVRIVDRDNRPTSGRLALSLAGAVRLSGAEAAFATWSSELPPHDGVRVLRGLGPRPLRIVATRAAPAASFDALATTIPYPWPAVATIVLAEP